MALSNGSFTRHNRDDELGTWSDRIEIARALLDNDPMTAYQRLSELETQLLAASADSRAAAALQSRLAYTKLLVARTWAAKTEWLARCSERERQFHARQWRAMQAALSA